MSDDKDQIDASVSPVRSLFRLLAVASLSTILLSAAIIGSPSLFSLVPYRVALETVEARRAAGLGSIP